MSRKNNNKKPNKGNQPKKQRTEAQKMSRKQRNNNKNLIANAAASALALMNVPNAAAVVSTARQTGAAVKRAIKGKAVTSGNVNSSTILTNANITSKDYNMVPNKSTTRFAHEEVMFSLYATSEVFSNTSYKLNPGSWQLFSILSQIAVNYTEYSVREFIVKYVPVVSQIQTSGSLGELGFLFNPNANQAPINGKREYINFDGVVFGAPTATIVCKLNPRRLPQSKFYITNNTYNPQSLLYDFATLQVAQFGINSSIYPAGTLLGEVHVKYDFTLEKMRLFSSIGKSAGYFSMLQNSNSTGSRYLFGDAYVGAAYHNTFSPANNLPVTTEQYETDSTHVVGGRLVFGDTMDGMVVRVMWYAKSTSAIKGTGDPVHYHLHNCRFLTDFTSTSSYTSIVPVETNKVAFIASGTAGSFSASNSLFIADILIQVDPSSEKDPYLELSIGGTASTSTIVTGMTFVTILPGEPGQPLTNYIQENPSDFVTTVTTNISDTDEDTLDEFSRYLTATVDEDFVFTKTSILTRR